jgi:hypothetical protein
MVHRSKIPLAVYPPIEGQVALAVLLDSSKRPDLSRDQTAVPCSDCILDVEEQIWDLFFTKQLDDFGPRTFARLFGFTRMDRLWDRDQFKHAVEAVLAGDRGRKILHDCDRYLRESIGKFRYEVVNPVVYLGAFPSKSACANSVVGSSLWALKGDERRRDRGDVLVKAEDAVLRSIQTFRGSFSCRPSHGLYMMDRVRFANRHSVSHSRSLSNLDPIPGAETTQ